MSRAEEFGEITVRQEAKRTEEAFRGKRERDIIRRALKKTLEALHDMRKGH